MIIDTMTKYEVMSSLRKEFDEEVLGYFDKILRTRLKAKYKALSERNKNFRKNIIEEYVSSNNVKYKLYLKIANGLPTAPNFTCEFRWKNKLCFGNFFANKYVSIYSAHCLSRYAERVLNNTSISAEEVFKKHIIFNQSSAYNIVLPTPTHYATRYFGMANALFLGDYDTEHPEAKHVWLNTCISYNETKYAQSKITQSLHFLQDFSNKCEGENICMPESKLVLNEFIRRNKNIPTIMDEFKEFAIKNYLLLKLHKSFDYDFSEKYIKELDEKLEYIEGILRNLGIPPESLSPYSKTHGITVKNEIDYKGEN